MSKCVPSPMYLDVRDAALILKKVQLASVATALANIVLPFPVLVTTKYQYTVTDIVILLSKITAVKNEATLSYHRVRGLYF